ncbi:ArsA family ATPase [Streptomyces alkaliterrae]|uniref:AAA family ATPase n=1 Tax=Streptomyces alkaliterrae TaxID=2213162 RepID=A0A5P0YR59_9ACTN|nr:ArsA family ATPase [Streptomyces alkaliterrae]MBB1253955.1 ArsA family ATPase [Streptomyces alkaliterrae]MBB1260623.1 ArsA family ATPase [Streptomyces alkaliterrae]MQS02380.1 AAA family ATPase [Streptomyces alkaliterrae]
MLLELIASRSVLFVGGKGGVGKTSVAAALALGRARAGGRVLLVSTDPAHNLGHLWDCSVGDEPTRLAEPENSAPGAAGYVDGLEIDPERTVEQHLSTVAATMRRLLPERMHQPAARHLELARQAPGTHESAVLERIAEAVELGEEAYDLVVFDTAPSGHTLRLLALPEQLTSWTEALLANRDRSERFGAAVRGLGGGREETDRDAELRRVLVRRRDRFARLREAVTDPARCGFVLVLTAEVLPIAETTEVYEKLAGLGVDVAALVANRRSPADAGALLARRREQEDGHLARLRRQLPGVPLLDVPLLPGDLVGAEALGALADLLGPSS